MIDKLYYCLKLNERIDLENMCLLPPDAGLCNNMTTRWYYDVSERTCRRFNYGGCMGNYNNFETLQSNNVSIPLNTLLKL